MAFQFYCPQGHLLEGHESQMGQQSQCPMCGAIFMIPVVQAGPAAPGGWPPGYQPPPGYAPPPGYGQPGYGQPGYGQPGYGQPAYPQPGYAPPGYGQPPAGYPGYPPQGPGFPAPGQPGWTPGYGQPPAEPGFPGLVTSGEAAGVPPQEAPPHVQTGAAGEAPPAEESKPAEPEKKEPRIVRIPCPQGHELQTPMDMVNQDVLCPICNTQFHLRYEDSLEFKEEQAELRRRKSEQLNQAALKWSIIAAVVVVLSIVGMILYLALRSPPEPTYPAPEETPAVDSKEGEAEESDVAKKAPAEADSEAKTKSPAAKDAAEEMQE
ncbi:MAG TPA: hypothetical protein VHB99_06160 [Pirellulales bacterium]|nr:hypothetical protein [Pirellulales bacterium]